MGLVVIVPLGGAVRGAALRIAALVSLDLRTRSVMAGTMRSGDGAKLVRRLRDCDALRERLRVDEQTDWRTLIALTRTVDPGGVLNADAQLVRAACRVARGTTPRAPTATAAS